MRMYLEPDGEARSLFWTLHGSVTQHGTARQEERGRSKHDGREPVCTVLLHLGAERSLHLVDYIAGAETATAFGAS